MRKPLIAGNWKMNGNRSAVSDLLQSLKKNSISLTQVDLAVFPPFVFLPQTQELLADTTIAWGGQTLSGEKSGAFTGEISATMLKDFGCRYVLVGHSERRSLFGETNEMIVKKCQAAWQADITPLICVGETLEQREKGDTYLVLRAQLEPIFSLPNAISALRHTILAYEPVWAIGTGLTADPEMAQNVHERLRSWVAEYDKEVAERLRILYGGSVKRDNAAALFTMPDIDGGLIGGASLNADEFLDIAKSCNK